MCEISLNIAETIKIYDGTLIVGNHDSITLWGIQPQNNLKDYARKVTALLLKETAELDEALVDVLTEIEQFEIKVNKPIGIFGKKRIQRKGIVKEYKKIMTYIEDMTLYFKLQQAQLIKEIKLLEKLSNTISECSVELLQCIDMGKKLLSNRGLYNDFSKETKPCLENNSDITVWFERLEKRVNDLMVSHTISMQSQAQIKMLRESNLLILDRMASIISNTFPVWQNQIAMILGLELLETRLDVQNKIIDLSDMHIKQASKKLQSKKESDVSLDKILENNQILSKALNEVVELEVKNSILRKRFLDVVHGTERGKLYE